VVFEGKPINISKRGPRNCRSLGFARDDKKERVVTYGRRWLDGTFSRGVQVPWVLPIAKRV
jgi:hypothetical protein